MVILAICGPETIMMAMVSYFSWIFAIADIPKFDF